MEGVTEEGREDRENGEGRYRRRKGGSGGCKVGKKKEKGAMQGVAEEKREDGEKEGESRCMEGKRKRGDHVEEGEKFRREEVVKNGVKNATTSFLLP